MMKKVLVATEKPFAAEAVDQIKEIATKAGYEIELLEKYTEKGDLLKAVADADAMIIRSDIVDAEVLDAAKQLKIVVRAGAGYDNIDLAAASAHNVVAMNTPGQNSNAVAELAIGMMIFQARKQMSGKSGSELKGKTLGIHAYGNVGKCVATIAKGFGMEIYAYDPYVSKEAIEADGVHCVDTDRGANCHPVGIEPAYLRHDDCNCRQHLLPDPPRTGLFDGVWPRALSLFGFPEGGWSLNPSGVPDRHYSDAVAVAFVKGGWIWLRKATLLYLKHDHHHTHSLP